MFQIAQDDQETLRICTALAAGPGTDTAPAAVNGTPFSPELASLPRRRTPRGTWACGELAAGPCNPDLGAI